INFTGDPSHRCEPVQCERSRDCVSDGDVCVQNRCMPVCSTHTVCGENAECIAGVHSYTCRCKSGYYGDPTVGCRRRLSCDNSQNCPSGQICSTPDHYCAVQCRSARDCLPGERCADGFCRQI